MGSGYWVPLTVLFVVKPDYGTMVAPRDRSDRGDNRRVTIAWAVVIILVFRRDDRGAVAVLAAANYALFPANYALSSVVLTVLIALLV